MTGEVMLVEQEEAPAESRLALLRKIAEEGLPIEEQAGIPTILPTSPEEQWALLKPYVGRPVRDIPKGLVILFTTPTGDKSSAQLTQKILALPPHVRQQVFMGAKESVFL